MALALAVVLLAATLLPAAADAANRRISISDYRWSSPDIHIDLGEHVTWYWVGPDTMHSVTGDSPNSLQFDSDPQTGQPNHDIGRHGVELLVQAIADGSAPAAHNSLYLPYHFESGESCGAAARAIA